MVRNLTPLSHRLPNLFDELFDRATEGTVLANHFSPPTNVVEHESSYAVSLDLPGMTSEDVDIELKDNQLWITGERKTEEESEGTTFHRVETRYGCFRRVITVPNDIHADQIEASFTNGVLTLTMPKVAEEPPKKIEIKS